MHHLIFQSVYIPMVLNSQIKLKYQKSLVIILHQLLKKTKTSANYSQKHFSGFIKVRNQNSFFLSPTNKYKIQDITSSLNSIKSVRPNSIPKRILKLLKNNISTLLICVISHPLKMFFLLYLKQPRLSLFIKKDPKLDFSNYRPISLLSNIMKILEKLMYNEIYKCFSENNIFYSLRHVIWKILTMKIGFNGSCPPFQLSLDIFTFYFSIFCCNSFKYLRLNFISDVLIMKHSLNNKNIQKVEETQDNKLRNLLFRNMAKNYIPCQDPDRSQKISLM